MTYTEEARKELTNLGFPKVDKLTDEQVDIIIQPSFAPEDYACDGEISPQQAYFDWKTNLKKFGLTPLQVFYAIKIML